MSKRLLLFIGGFALAALGATLAGFSQTKPPAAKAPARPKLILLITIDQFRNDYIDRFKQYFVAGGFNRLMSGARFTNCRYDYASTVTGPGHATLATGAYPNTHGIIANNWYDRALKRQVNCVEDLNTRIVDSAQGSSERRGASPRSLLGSTFGDELRMASGFESKVISIAVKDRGAILPGGHTANAAYWYQAKTGAFVSSTYYMAQLPAWVADFNSRNSGMEFCGRPWKPLTETPGAAGRVLNEYKPESGETCPSPRFLSWMTNTPYQTEIEMRFAREVIRQEKLGQGSGTDVLTLALCANDFVGHRWGPYSPQVADMTLRTDRELASLLDDIDRMVGLGNVWIAVSSDHGIPPTPQFIKARKLGFGLFEPQSIRKAVEERLDKVFGDDDWVDDVELPNLFLDREVMAKHQVSVERASEEAVEAAMKLPGVFAAYSRSQLSSGMGGESPLDRKVANSFNLERSGDVFVVLEPFAVPAGSETQTTHGSPWGYDAEVPMILWGTGFRPGVYHDSCQPTDLAPTLSSALGLSQPSGASGSPLAAALMKR